MIRKEIFSATVTCFGGDTTRFASERIAACESLRITQEGFNDYHALDGDADPLLIYSIFVTGNSTFYSFVTDLYNVVTQLHGCKVENIFVTYGYDGQCNLSFTPAEMQLITAMHTDFLISCYQVSTDDEEETA